MLRRYDIIGFPLVNAKATFLSPAAFGDRAEIESQITTVRRAGFTVEHRISVGERLAVEGAEERVWATRHPDDPARIRPKAIPDAVATRLAAL